MKQFQVRLCETQSERKSVIRVICGAVSSSTVESRRHRSVASDVMIGQVSTQCIQLDDDFRDPKFPHFPRRVKWAFASEKKSTNRAGRRRPLASSGNFFHSLLPPRSSSGRCSSFKFEAKKTSTAPHPAHVVKSFFF